MIIISTGPGIVFKDQSSFETGKIPGSVDHEFYIYGGLIKAGSILQVIAPLMFNWQLKLYLPQ